MTTRRPLSLATFALLGATLLAYAAELSAGGMPVCERLGFVPERFLRTGDLLPLVSYLLLHDPINPLHLVGNVALLGIFGPIVERHLGAIRLLGVYVGAGIAGAFGHLLVAPEATDALVGNSGSVFALLAIGAVIDVGTLPFVGLLFASNLVALVYPSPWLVPATTSVGCHVGGFVVGAATAFLARARGVRWAVARGVARADSARI